MPLIRIDCTKVGHDYAEFSSTNAPSKPVSLNRCRFLNKSLQSSPYSWATRQFRHELYWTSPYLFLQNMLMVIVHLGTIAACCALCSVR